MEKQILELLRTPFRIRLRDNPCSIFISDRDGQILIDEGEGDDRMNGAVLYADQDPRFEVSPNGANLRLNCGSFQLDLGYLPANALAAEWVHDANNFLFSKALAFRTPEPERKPVRRLQPVASVGD